MKPTRNGSFVPRQIFQIELQSIIVILLCLFAVTPSSKSHYTLRALSQTGRTVRLQVTRTVQYSPCSLADFRTFHDLELVIVRIVGRRANNATTAACEVRVTDAMRRRKACKKCADLGAVRESGNAAGGNFRVADGGFSGRGVWGSEEEGRGRGKRRREEIRADIDVVVPRGWLD